MDQQISRWNNKYNNVNELYNNEKITLYNACRKNNITTTTYYNICKKLNKPSVGIINCKNNIQNGGSNKDNMYNNIYNNVNELYTTKLLRINECCRKNNITTNTYYNICKRLNKPSIAKTSSKSHNNKQIGGNIITTDYDVDLGKYSRELDNIVNNIKQNRNI